MRLKPTCHEVERPAEERFGVRATQVYAVLTKFIYFDAIVPLLGERELSMFTRG